MTRPVPDPRRLLRRIGWPALGAGALVLLAVLLYALGVRQAQREVDALKLQAEAAQQRLRSGSLEARKAPATVAEQLRTFQAFFPRADSLPHWLDTIHTIGRGSGLVIRSGEYRLERPEQGPWRYHVTLPVAGNYLQVRQFITFVLREVPSASLDDVQLRREAGSDRVEARLRFSLHLIGS